jgi:iron(III) transport system substrate-binding protein
MKRWKSILMFLAVSMIMLSLTVPSFAAKDRILAYTTLDEPLARAVFEAYEKDTGVKVEWVRLSTGEAVARMEAERKNPQVDIWFGGVGLGHIEAKDKGLTTPYVSPNAKNIPAKFKDKDGYWTGIYAGALCFVSNINRLKELGVEAPKSWADALKPEFKGHIQMANPASSGTAYNVIATVVQLWGEEKGFEYMRDLHKNISQYTKSGSAPGKNAAIGEIPVGIGYAHDQVKLVSQGYPLVITFPSEGTGFEVASISLVKGGPNPELAKRLIDWALTERAAKLYAAECVVPFVDVPLKKGAIPISQVNTINQDDVWAAANSERLIERWQNEIYRR